MEVKFRQKGIGWCTVYTWANLLNECGVLRLCEDEKFKGCTEDEENELLQMFCPEVKTKTLAYINPAIDLRFSSETIWSVITKKDEITFCEEQAAIHLLSVRHIEAYWHHIGTVTYNDEVYLIDPIRENWVKINDADELSLMFLDCCQISRPVLIETNTFASFNAIYFQYPFLKSQLA